MITKLKLSIKLWPRVKTPFPCSSLLILVPVTHTRERITSTKLEETMQVNLTLIVLPSPYWSTVVYVSDWLGGGIYWAGRGVFVRIAYIGDKASPPLLLPLLFSYFPPSNHQPPDLTPPCSIYKPLLVTTHYSYQDSANKSGNAVRELDSLA